MSNLVIVESPAKAGTIKGYLGKGYKVVASKGHVRDLPKSSLGVDIENGFAPKYINIRGKGDLIKDLKKEAKNASVIYLATDPDREGEAISWHLSQALNLPAEKTRRVSFNEVTKNAVREAIKSPGSLDMKLVDSQQARRILDRIVGYQLSPILWRKIKSGLSAGRVQSVATRIIVDRENEIRAFVPEEFWRLEAHLITEGKKALKANFYGDKNGKIALKNGEQTARIVSACEKEPFVVTNIKKSVRYKNPAPPFITSTLQQEANRRFSFQSAKTMKTAQELYEGISLGGATQGIITYMRTDSLRVSEDAAASAKEYITAKYGAEFYPKTRRIYKSRAGSQDAHEAIRPSDMKHEPDRIRSFLTADQYKLYKLIWERFVASQMESAALDTVSIDIESAGFLFRSSGYTVKFTGFMAVYEESTDEEGGSENDEKETKLPEVSKNEPLRLSSLLPSRHFTQPPLRYTEASLIKALEEKGIGRPSTYTPTITTILQRGYVEREGKSLFPSPLGEITTSLMMENFTSVVDYAFTAKMENMLDEIENGNKRLLDVLNEFYQGFSKMLESAENNIGEKSYLLPAVETDILCDKCGAKMIVKSGRFGKFAACPNYPDCKNTKPLDQNGNKKTDSDEGKTAVKPAPDDVTCALCGGGMVVRKGRYGNFYACARYPECKGTKPITKDMNIPCPLCGAKIVIKHGKNRSVFYSCERYPDCKFSSWDIPQNETCPVCKSVLMRKKGKDLVYCYNQTCDFKKNAQEESAQEK